MKAAGGPRSLLLPSKTVGIRVHPADLEQLFVILNHIRRLLSSFPHGHPPSRRPCICH